MSKRSKIDADKSYVAARLEWESKRDSDVPEWAGLRPEPHDAPTLTDDQERAWLAHLAACVAFGGFASDEPTPPPTNSWGDRNPRFEDREVTRCETIRTRANFHAIRVRDGLGDFTWADRVWRLGRDGFEMVKD